MSLPQRGILCYLVVVIGCRKCSNKPGMSCSCKLFAVHLFFDMITEQINDDDDDENDDVHVWAGHWQPTGLQPRPYGRVSRVSVHI